jgi:hypothetical protein
MARIDLDIRMARTIGGALRQTIAAEREDLAAAPAGIERNEIASRLARLQDALTLIEQAEDAAAGEYRRVLAAEHASA